jgi:hypothetical protein
LRVRKVADPLPRTMLTGRFSSCCFARPIERVRPRNSHGAVADHDGLAKSFSGVQQARLDAHRASLPQPSSWTSAHAQGLFSSTILGLVVFDGFRPSHVPANSSRCQPLSGWVSVVHAPLECRVINVREVCFTPINGHHPAALRSAGSRAILGCSSLKSRKTSA